MRSKRRSWVLAILGLVGGLAACPSGQRDSDDPRVGLEDPPAELVLVGGIVHTLDQDTPQTAVAIGGGRILRVGSDEDVSSLIVDGTKVVGLEGRTVVPGLSDGHMHLFGLGAVHHGLDLVGTRSLEEVRAKVRRAVRRAKPGEWIRGRGWDQNDWTSFKKKRRGAFPSAKDLDDIASNNPVVLTRVDGHAVWVNSAAMRAAGITRSTRSPRGGRIVKRGSKPTGIFIDNAIPLVRSHVPPLSKTQIKAAYLAGQQRCLETGLTQVHDMGVSEAELDALRTLDRAGELKLRVYAMLDGSVEDLSALMEDGPQTAQGKQRLTVRGVKFFADGALGSRGAALFEPYSDEPKNRGLILTDPNFLEARIRTAKDKGFQVATHAIGDRANSLMLDIYGRVFRADALAHRPRIEHAQVVALEDIARFGQLHVIPSMQPTHATSDMPWAEKRVGSERIQGAYAWQRMRAVSATIAAGSDAPVESVAPLEGLYAAISRRDQEGMPPSGWYSEQALSPVEALEAFTRGNAWASFREDRAGKIRQGFDADLTVLSIDPIKATASELLGAKVELTIIAGQIVHKRPGADRPPKPAPPPPPPAPVKTATPTAAPQAQTSTSS